MAQFTQPFSPNTHFYFWTTQCTLYEFYFIQVSLQRKGMAFQVRHGPSIEKGHGFLGQALSLHRERAWSLHRERAWFVSSGFVFVNYPVFHGYLFIHCLGSHHVLCLSGIVCAHILCSILDFCGLFVRYIFYLSPMLQGNLFLFHK